MTSKRKKQRKTYRPNLHIEHGHVIVDNPNWSPDHPESPGNLRKITVIQNTRSSPLIFMATHYTGTGKNKRRIISLSQFRAGHRFNSLHMTKEVGGIKGHDWITERVDGGTMSDGITEKRNKAIRELSIARARLGDEGYQLVESVCGWEIAIHRLYKPRKERDDAMNRLRRHLDTLASLWGYSSIRRAS